jgi:hypothetical protein
LQWGVLSWETGLNTITQLLDIHTYEQLAGIGQSRISGKHRFQGIGQSPAVVVLSRIDESENARRHSVAASETANDRCVLHRDGPTVTDRQAVFPASVLARLFHTADDATEGKKLKELEFTTDEH